MNAFRAFDFRPLGLALGWLLVAGTAQAQSGAVPTPPDFLQSYMDPSVDPGVDFFTYAVGRWLQQHPIPAAEAGWSIGHAVQEQLYVNLRQINEEASAGTNAPGSDRQQIGDFWATAMDVARAQQLGAQPLDAELDSIAAIRTSRAALDVAFALAPLGVHAFMRVGVLQDEKHSDVNAVHLGQGGLGLPERDFYFNRENGVARIRAEYVDHLARVLALLGRAPAQAERDARRVMAFETALARASRKLEDLRDPQRNYHAMTPAEATRLAPALAWGERLAAWNLHPAQVIVGQPEFFGALQRLLRATPVPVLRDYLRLHLIDSYAPTLSAAFAAEDFRFHGQVLSGRKAPRERWKRVLDAEGRAMGMVLGRIFVQDFFPATAKERYVKLVDAIRDAYGERIAKLEWMSPATKAKALQKLAAITPKVGYPDHWKDYSALVVGRDSYCQNMKNAARWAFNDALAKYGKPVDRSEWEMTPQTYNAYYNPSNNEIVLPAAIFLVPEVADAAVDDAVVYGYAGASTIGHEITHGFDDEGRQFDAAGNLSQWWTADDEAKFVARAGVLAVQFDRYEPLPGLHINGKASLGENIADFGGVRLGLDAFKKTAEYRKGEMIGGLTPLQRYFLGYALGWMSQQREESLRASLLSDVHAPAKWRVLGPLSDTPEFYEAFGIKPGQPMWRPEAERVVIW